MAIKLDNLFEWRHFPKGEILTLPGTDVRRIRLNVNSPDPCRMYLVDASGEVIRFLAVTYSCDVVEFYANDVVRIAHTSDDVYIYTADDEPDFNVFEDPEKYTKMFERRERNPEFERMMHMANMNMQRNMQAYAERIEADYERKYAGSVFNANSSGADAPKPSQQSAGQAADQQPPAGDGVAHTPPAGGTETS